MVTVGITGGIGSGKSTVCEIWRQQGAYVLNADVLAKEIMATDPQVKKELIATFGERTFFEDGTLNRDYLAEEAFGRSRVAQLNNIVHPRMPQAASKKMQEARKEGREVFVYEAALLLENLEPGVLDYIVLVLADRERRIERVHQRDDLSVPEIEQRMEKQRNFEEVSEQADFIIRNNGSLEELKKKANDVYQNFLL